MSFAWPHGFERIPPDAWVHHSVEDLAVKYDSVEQHGWYQNLVPTLDALEQHLKPGDVWVDYSGGTGILVDQLMRRAPKLDTGAIIVDASPKFLRLALNKLGHSERVGYRWIQYRKSDKRLDYLDEVLPPALAQGGVKLLASTNAIHLYYDLDDTLRAWRRVLAKGATVLVQSGNMANPDAAPGHWIIDDTVERLQSHALELVEKDARYAALKSFTHDAALMQRYADLRQKYFLPPRPVSFYVDALNRAELPVRKVETRAITARVDEWYEFLSAYHDGVLGWAGGVEKLEGRAPEPAHVRLRLTLLRDALRRLFDGKDTFLATWTYVTAG